MMNNIIYKAIKHQRLHDDEMPFTVEQQQLMSHPPRLAIEAIHSGAGELSHYSDLDTAINIVLIAMDNADKETRAAQHALTSIKKRYESERVWGFSGDELKAIAAGLDMYETVLAVMSAYVMREVILEYMNRLSAGMALKDDK